MLRAIVERHLPSTTVWVFGSRSVGRSVWRYSDVDLAIEGGLPSVEKHRIAEAFEESLLPVSVDLVALDDVHPDFATRIRPDLVLLQQGSDVYKR